MNGSKHCGSSIKALAIISCMLLCTVSPMMATWCDDGYDSYAVTDDTFTYISLGDSMVNGFGMTGYYSSNNENTYGFMVDVKSSYPHMLAAYLNDNMPHTNVEHLQLGTSSMRSSELRAILDPSFTGDSGTQGFLQDPSGAVNRMKSKLPDGYEKNIDGIRAYYTDSLTRADLVTYQFHYDIGFITSNTLSKLIDDSVNLMPLDLSIYIDEEYLEFFENVKVQITNMLREKLSSIGVGDGTLDTFERYTDRIIDGLSYIVVSYCANFDANMELMLELNPDVKILVIDNYNTFIDMNIVYNELSVPISSVYDLFLDILNMYTKYMSPYSEKVYHISMGLNPDLFIDEFKDNTKGDNISNDAKNVMMAVLQGHSTVDPKGYVQYDMLDDYTINPNAGLIELFWSFMNGEVKKNHDNLSEFLHYVFNTTVIDAGLILDPAFDMETEIVKLTEKMTRIVIDMDNFNIPFDLNDLSSITLDNIRKMNLGGVGYLMQPGATITFDESTGSCTVSCVNGSETFSKIELALLRMNFYVLKTSAVMTHPCEKGHTQIFNEIKDKIEERDVLGSDTVDEPSIYSLLFEDPLPVYGDLDASPISNGTLLNLGTMSSGYGSDRTYPSIVADALGLEISPVKVPSDARVEDVNYLIGGTDRHDAYTDGMMNEYCSGLGMTASEIQSMYRSAVEGSDTILVSLGSNNLLYPLIQFTELFTGGTPIDYDISSLGIVSEEMYADYMKVREHLDALVTGMFGDSQEIMDAYDMTVKATESAMYSALGYIDDYFKLVGKLHELNPDADIICIGNYNVLDGFVISGTVDVDVGMICSKIIGLFNTYNGYMLSQCEGVTYIDILDIHENEVGFTITGDMDGDDVMSAIMLCMLTGDEHQEIADRILDMYDIPSNNSGDNTLLIVGGVAAAIIIGMIAVVFVRRH